ncbi:MAG: CoA transferase [Actinobacteria bacterium]|nr:CoA transferase [Actinomycetota bacterium]MQB00163.1 CoA transferase [Actinomycetota bacterium]
MEASSSAGSTKALDGVRVLEVGMFIAGPFAGQQLGDLGAEIIKIENPEGGDPMRHWRDFGQGDLWWHSIARNKKSVTLNLSDRRSHPVFLELVRGSDIVLESFRPGTLERWGIGPDALFRANPALVITRVSGFGQTGPRAKQPGFGSVGEATGGIRHLTGWPNRASTRVGISLGDEVASLFAVAGTLAALRHAERTGRGQVVDTAIYEAVFAMMESLVAEYELAGVTRGRTGPTLPGVVPSNVYPTLDGDDVLIAANSDPIYARLVKALALDELATDESLADHTIRGGQGEKVDQTISRRTRQLSTDELIRLLEDADVPHGKVFTAPDMVADPHYRARQMIVRRDVDGVGPVAMPAPVPRLSQTPGRIDSTGPCLGAHTEEVLCQLTGLSATTVLQLRDQGVV